MEQTHASRFRNHPAAAFLLLLTTPCVFAAPSVDFMKSADSGERMIDSVLVPTINMSSRWRLFGGAAIGRGTILDSGYIERPEGNQLLISGIASYVSRQWVVDLGLGWFYSQFEGTQASGARDRVRTRAGVIDVSPRYRLGGGLQIGPVMYVSFGTDTSFAARFSRAWSAEIFAGGKFAYDFNLGRGFPLRVFTQLTTDLTIRDRQSYLSWAGVQIGIPVGLESYALTDEIPSSSAKPSGAPLILSVSSDPIFFGTNSSRLLPEAEARLARIGAFLEAHGLDWEGVRVDGHADQRGTSAHNLTLSARRARAVLEAMRLSAASAARSGAEGFGFSRLKDSRNTPEGWRVNRRVEITIDCIANQELFESELSKLAVIR